MKRKLPQWLLDATNNNDKSPKQNPTESIRKNSNESHNHDVHIQTARTRQTEPDQHSNQIHPNRTISVVPLANLQAPSRCDAPINTTSSSNSIHTPEDTEMCDELRPTEPTSTEIVPVIIKTEPVDQIVPIASSASNEQRPVVVKQEIKDEPVDTATSTASTLPAPTLVPNVAKVKPERRSCNYGIKCFR